MKLTRKVLKDYKSSFPDFDYYYLAISKIEENELLYPDVCIESCKSLIEGVCKTIILQFDKQVTLTEIEGKKYSVQKLYRDSIKVLDKEISKLDQRSIGEFTLFEVDYLMIYSQGINILSEIRNKRGDISHGRAAPKIIFSCSKFSRTIKAFTDAFISYILDFYFIIVENLVPEKLEYDKLDAFNRVLDEEVYDFPVSKAKYSKVLYDYDYIFYETRYNDYINDKPKESIKSEPKIERLDIYTYWNNLRLWCVSEFSKSRNLKYDEVLSMIDNHISLDRPLHKIDVESVMVSKPLMMQRTIMVNRIKEEILKLVAIIKKAK